MKIIFESHATTFDNEAQKVSGWHDAKLSPAGIEQAKAMGKRYRSDQVGAVFTSESQW
jgi:broad specificity phosphatase PhoE